MICDLHFVGPGAYLGQLLVILPTLKSFNCLHTVCFMYGLSIYEKKDMSPHSIFHNLTWKFSAFYKFSEKFQVT